MSGHPQQDEPATLGTVWSRLFIVGRAKGWPPLEAPGMYVGRGVDAWAHWASWRVVAASRGDRAAANDLVAAIRLGEQYVEPEPEADAYRHTAALG